ncbi:MAG: hypothetical protein PSX36_01035 [bacterium]|nr:hypothetical protein [bacterium]
MKTLRILLFFILTVLWCAGFSQQEYTKSLLKADKLYIKQEYDLAVMLYVEYLDQYPRDYYAARQAALCYEKLNDPNSAIDYWPMVVESMQVTEQDYFSYARSLLSNNRVPDAQKVFLLLAKSQNSGLAEWGKVYKNPARFYMDSSFTKVFEAKVLNSNLSESCPFFLGEKVLYLRDRAPTLRIFSPVSDRGTQFIFAFTRNDSLQFSNTTLYNKFLNIPIYGQISFSPDGSLLYFCKPVSNADMDFPSPYPFNKYQLYTLKMSTLNDAHPEIKPFKYNNMLYDFMHPCVSQDGNRLYFSSDMKGSMGGKDIFVCEWNNNDWDPPVNVGKEINSVGHDVYPHVTQQGELYYSSNFRPGMGGLDIFHALPSKEPTKMFEEAKNAGANLNSRYDDFGIYFLYGGTKGYLSSNRKNGSDDDIFYFSISR